MKQPHPLAPFATPAVVAAMFAAFACFPTAATRAPSLGEIVGRVDVRRVVECARQPTPGDAARCLGAQVMTAGLQLALDRAAELAGDAIAAVNPGAGAADSDAADPRLAADLDSALGELQAELDAARSLTDTSKLKGQR